eukprot:4008861-Amphidinium_carterae.2
MHVANMSTSQRVGDFQTDRPAHLQATTSKRAANGLDLRSPQGRDSLSPAANLQCGTTPQHQDFVKYQYLLRAQAMSLSMC